MLRVLEVLLVLGILLAGSGAILGTRVLPGVVHAATICGNPPTCFTFSLNPNFFHLAPSAAATYGNQTVGEGRNITVTIQRSTGFSGEVNFSLLQPPQGIISRPLAIAPGDSNGTLQVIASPQVPLGTYNLTVLASAAGGAGQMAPLSLRIVPAHKVITPDGWAVVYNTTKPLDSASLGTLTSYSNGVFTFMRPTQLVQGLLQGDVIGITTETSNVFPQGGLLLVFSVSHSAVSSGQTYYNVTEVTTQPARLLDAVQQAHLISNGTVFANTGVQAPSPATDESYTLVDNHWGLSETPVGGGAELSAYVGYSLKLDYNLDIERNSCLYDHHLCPVPYINQLYLLLDGSESANLSLTSPRGAQLNWENDKIQTLFSYPAIQILPGILWVNIQGDLAGKASGLLNQTVDAHVYQSIAVKDRPEYDQNLGMTFVHTFTHSWGEKFEIGNGTNSAVPAPRVSLGPRVEAALDSPLGSGGVYIEGDAFVELDDSGASFQPSWTLYGGLNLNGGVTADLALLGYTLASWSYNVASYDVYRVPLAEGPVNVPNYNFTRINSVYVIFGLTSDQVAIIVGGLIAAIAVAAVLIKFVVAKGVPHVKGGGHL